MSFTNTNNINNKNINVSPIIILNRIIIQLPSDNGVADNFLWCLNNAGMQYRLLINKGLKPQEARGVLPNATKTELVMTGFESDWESFFKLRCSGAAHPGARKLADKLRSLMNVNFCK